MILFDLKYVCGILFFTFATCCFFFFIILLLFVTLTKKWKRTQTEFLLFVTIYSEFEFYTLHCLLYKVMLSYVMQIYAGSTKAWDTSIFYRTDRFGSRSWIDLSLSACLPVRLSFFLLVINLEHWYVSAQVKMVWITISKIVIYVTN